MTGRLRVFVSSTMKDLANERAAVVEELERFNFEPVNAESVLPTGDGSWTVIEMEIASCDVFILILGESYGWIPSHGPHSTERKAVTELEYLAARAHEIPILPFCKRLGYGTNSTSDDALQRDRFRREVESWDNGHFRAEFDLARDLASTVSSTVTNLLTMRWREVSSRRTLPAYQPSALRGEDLPPIPDALLRSVADRDAILFAGAGMSLEAGLPSAYAFTESMIAKINSIDPTYRPAAHGTNLNDIATDLARLLGVGGLQSSVAELLQWEEATEPSEGHRLAVKLFDLVVTTNYDTLLEKADPLGRMRVVVEEIDEDLPDHALVKLHGSFTDPTGLILTAEDLREYGNRRRRTIARIQERLRTSPVVVVGSSLRDPTTEELFAVRDGSVAGWVVAPALSKVEGLRLAEWGLQPMKATADKFFKALGAALHGSE